MKSLVLALGAALLAACGSSTPPVETQAQANGASPAEASTDTPAAQPTYDTARGGRIFDKWAAETGRKVDDGPPRLKDLFGWDLRGQAGMYGPERMNKPKALPIDLLSWQGDVAAIAERLANGSDGVPAYGSVLQPDELLDLAALIVDLRDGKLPRADQILTLQSPAAKDYALLSGGDATRGKALYGERCAGCHGDDGTRFLIDDGEYSLGSHARQKAYEDWFKLLSGQPGTKMHRQVQGDAAQMRQELLDLLTALCDRTTFPKGKASKDDVADGDPRCGAALR